MARATPAPRSPAISLTLSHTFFFAPVRAHSHKHKTTLCCVHHPSWFSAWPTCFEFPPSTFRASSPCRAGDRRRLRVLRRRDQRGGGARGRAG
eukprot:4364673-Pleurochrysis_carterae.AAC.1